MILKVNARLSKNSEDLNWISRGLEPKSVGRGAWLPIQTGSHILSVSDLNKTPHILPTTLQWGCGEGLASAFLSFSGNGRAGGGQLSGQCCKGLGLSNSPVSGKSYIEGRYNPQKPSLRQRTQTSLTDRRLYLGIWTESCWVEKRRENLSKFSGVFIFFAFLSFPAWSHSLNVCLSLNQHPPTISIQMVFSLQGSFSPASTGITSAKLSTLMLVGPGASDRQN